MANSEKALIVQSDRTILLDLASPFAEEARRVIARFSELTKSPEYLHTYSLCPLSIWNACSAGMAAEEMIKALSDHAKYPVPESVCMEIEMLAGRFGLAKLHQNGTELFLRVERDDLRELFGRDERVAPFLGALGSDGSFSVRAEHRGVLKQGLVTLGYPALDLAGYKEGESFEIDFKDTCLSGQPFLLREYQRKAVEAFHESGNQHSGCGVIVLPCGAGKTIVGMAAMAVLKSNTLILTTGITSARQWRREILDKTTVNEKDISEYSGEGKNIGPITIATYQVLTYRPPSKESDESEVPLEYPHLELFRARSWGLIIYDEVHLLPAPIFRITAELQSRRRLGLTATLIREDGREGDVFALIGPKSFEIPWRDLEEGGFIATAKCTEIRVPQSTERQMEYALSTRRSQFRIAAESPSKLRIVQDLLEKEKSRRILIIGEFLTQLEELQKATDFPIITGKTPQTIREQLYQDFRFGRLPGLILSRVGNFAVDLPDADVMIQVSGKYGSRQEEAQRLGRILRPKRSSEGAHFYTLVSSETCEEEFARHRQLFLVEQGYSYQIEKRV